MTIDIEQGTNKFSSDHVQNPYITWKIVTQYQMKRGLLAMGTASGEDRAPCDIVAVKDPTGRKIVSWVVERQGAPPALPDPDKDSEDQKLDSFSIVPHSPDLMADGNTYTYRVEGTYNYILTRPIYVQDGKFFMGGSPFDITPSAVNVLSPGQFNKELTP